ncbi:MULTISPECIES: Zn-ribbon domain-containing OB-fold protein [Cupriavidus]|uniref:OB-fold protein n=2 Tax=Cupriavidus TaxID=106589 RepID=A0A7W4YT98_9BURK|nr:MULTISPECIES: OB-fold domain-containing protein [Cupriavidus]MBB3009899.1 hypothetical protein [Cupriavidus alkaliphilus]QBY56226.1 hypothetical protein E0W60_34810 [Cupriavidus oxalaticus]
MPEIPPLQEGLYADVDGVPRLLASRCDACDRLFFPRRQYCGRCSSPALRDLALSAHGTLHAWSLIDRRPKLAVIDSPYVQAEVAMPEGVHVFTVLRDCEAAQLRTGLTVEMFVGEIPRPGGEGKVHAYMFRPVAGKGGQA